LIPLRSQSHFGQAVEDEAVNDNTAVNDMGPGNGYDRGVDMQDNEGGEEANAKIKEDGGGEQGSSRPEEPAGGQSSS
jgi:hypothetical protein